MRLVLFEDAFPENQEAILASSNDGSGAFDPYGALDYFGNPIITPDQLNQVSIGLVQTVDHKIIVYMMPEGKQEDDAAALCNNENNEDYLPLVGVRTRRLGEQYPYKALQGYRQGQNVEIIVYMQKDNGLPLPPPARVVVYMHEPLVPNAPVIISNGNIIMGVSAVGTIGYTEGGWPSNGAFALTYKDIEFIVQGNNFDISSWRVPSSIGTQNRFYIYNDLFDHTNPAEYISIQTKIAENQARQNLGLKYPSEYLQITKLYTISTSDIVIIDTTIKNINAVSMGGVSYYMHGFNPNPDATINFDIDDKGRTDNSIISNDLRITSARDNAVAVGIGCKSSIPHVTKLSTSQLDAIFVYNLDDSAEDSIYADRALYVVFQIPDLLPDQSITVRHYLIFGVSEADIINKFNALTPG